MSQRYSPGAFGVGQLRSNFTVLITSLTVPQSGRLKRAASASLSTMVMSFSAQGIGFSSGRVASDQLPALDSSSAARNVSRSTKRERSRARQSNLTTC